jgi:hypothetical protein
MRSKMQSVASLTCVGERKGTPSELFVKVVNNATFDCYDDQYSSKKLGLLCPGSSFLGPKYYHAVSFQFIFTPFIIFSHAGGVVLLMD